MPWTVLQRKSETPVDVAGFGLVSADDARDLIAAAARDPRTRWCVTGLHPDGTGPGRPQQYLNVTMTPIARGHCDHAHAEARYKPSRALQHLIRVRNARCTAPGCSRPAAPLRPGSYDRVGSGRDDVRVRPGSRQQVFLVAMYGQADGCFRLGCVVSSLA